jgi:hypothetical protein
MTGTRWMGQIVVHRRRVVVAEAVKVVHLVDVHDHPVPPQYQQPAVAFMRMLL